MTNENVIDEINLIALNIPEGISPLEKLRWLYVKLGNVFCYDYNYMDRDENYSSVDFEKNYVGRYQSCIEISNIFNLIANNIDTNIKCEIIERNNARIRGIGEEKHVCNLITFSSGEKFIFDLTLDLYLIQSGCTTREFGFTTMNGDEDIISLYECREMDQKLGLLNKEYTDYEIDKYSMEVSKLKFSDFKEMLDYQISIINKLMCSFKGYQEGKNYLSKLFSKILKCNRKEFNLKHENGKMISCYMFTNDIQEEWYIFDGNLGLIKTNPNIIYGMLQNGWKTKSFSLGDILEKGRIR